MRAAALVAFTTNADVKSEGGLNVARKQNHMLAKLDARHQAELSAARIFAVQQCRDMLVIAANEAFGFGPDRVKLLLHTFDKVFTEYAEMTIQDAKTDKEIWYEKDKLDARLREICGEHFAPWDERYK